MQIGLQIPDYTWPGGPARLGRDLAEVARAAEEAGFDYISVMDHFFQIGVIGPPDGEMLEAYTTLGYLAGCTDRARLVTLVTGAVYRYPGVLAKIVTTLDVLKRHCETEGRDYDTIEKTCLFTFDAGEKGAGVGKLIGRLKRLASLGIDTVIGSVPGVETLEPLETLGRDLIPAAAQLRTR